MKSELKFEWRSGAVQHGGKKLPKPTEGIHLEHVTLDDEHQSTRGFPYPEVHNIPVGIVYFVFEFEVIQYLVGVRKVCFRQKSIY
jgi:hypothetical protein